MRFLFAAALSASVFIGFQAAPLRAHEGHDHAQPKLTTGTSTNARGEATSEAFELVAVARGDVLAVYLNRFATNEPVERATINVETPAGPAVAKEIPGDAYTLPAPWLPKAGAVDLIFTVTAGDATDILPVTLTVPGAAHDDQPQASGLSWFNNPLPIIGAALAGLLIGASLMASWRRAIAAVLLSLIVLGTAPSFAHEGEDHGDQAKSPAAPTSDLAQRLPDGRVYVPKAAQRIFAVRTVVTESAVHHRTTELPGRVIPDPNASGFVQAAIGGRLSPPPGGFPRLGTPVKAGDVLAYVTPPMQAIDVSDMRQRQGELDQQIAIAERKLARTETLAPSGAVARFQLEDSRSEVAGLKERRAMLDKSRREAEALIAPVSGVVADGNAVAGQIAQPNAIVFHIIDPEKLWIEALSFEVIRDARGAYAKTAAGKIFNVSHRGSGFADRSQSIPVHFAIESGDLSELRAGQFVSVIVRTEAEVPGIAIPRSALVRAANGQDIVFEHVTAEIFAPRAVRTAPLDGERVLISAGVEPGKRIVTQAAELLDHVR
ncbi:HlyD family efflux transporter periplasmic adaptor subunit [Bradyrhizobium sp. AUGA SZCCT0431]|uniref:efflux RND transporter periplasmic adaptor subunit n=1 Tax=Bradyrhizobium sp. AUGA SZCCT0431 TaxID=2807674 RepID=UPI001BAD194C|nr:HlyD family efflux transporter periplasmic adaptor subunit [Bradyrhizobium sp. AUGA SZCCT0431]